MSASAAKVRADGSEACGSCGRDVFQFKMNTEKGGLVFVDFKCSCGRHIIKKFKRYTKREEVDHG